MLPIESFTKILVSKRILLRRFKLGVAETLDSKAKTYIVVKAHETNTNDVLVGRINAESFMVFCLVK